MEMILIIIKLNKTSSNISTKICCIFNIVTLGLNLSKKGGTFPRQCIQFHLLLFPAHIEFNFSFSFLFNLTDLDIFKMENKSGFINRELKKNIEKYQENNNIIRSLCAVFMCNNYSLIDVW